MHRDVEDGGIVVEDVLDAVSVVRVPIEHEDALTPIAQRRRGDRGVVQQTKTHRVARHGVVTGRADRAERGRALAPLQRIDGLQPGAGRKQRRLPRADRHGGVGIERAAARRTELLEPIEVIAGMDPLELRAGRAARLEAASRVGEARILQPGDHGLVASGPLGVTAAGLVVRVARVGRVEEHESEDKSENNERAGTWAAHRYARMR